MKNFTRKFIGLLIIAFTLFISQSYAQLSLHVNTTTNSVYFSNSFPVSVSVYDFNLVSSTPWSVTTSSGIDFGSYGCNNETFGDGSSAYMCGIHSGYWEPYASGLISLDGQPLYSGSGSAGGIGNNVISIDYTSSDQANGIPVEGNVYNISGGGQSTSVPSGNRHIAYMAPQTIEYIYAEAHTGGGNMTSIPVYINGQLLEQDCAGTWGGSSVNDACGVCDGDNSSCSGCTSSWASNYDQDATIDDESCVLSGCTDQTAINYNQNATDDDGSCIALILGCMDAEAVNYDANANTDNGMCQPYTLADVESAEDAAYADGLVAGFADGHADGVIYGSPILIDAIIDLPEGWSMFGYTCIESMNVIDGFSEIASNIVIVKDYLGNAYLTDWNFNAIGDLQYGEGYQIKMTEEVDSFYFCQTHTLKIYGCIDETALNYNSGANTDDGSCIAAVTGCMDESALNYHPGANTDDASCIEVVLGCMDETACNLNDVANTEDDSCLYLEEGFDCDGNCLNPNSAGVCEGFEIFGCTDSDGGSEAETVYVTFNEQSVSTDSYSLNSCVSNEGIGWGTYMIMTAGPDNSLIIENFNNDICTDNQYWIDNGHPLSNTLYSSNEFMQYSFIFDDNGGSEAETVYVTFNEQSVSTDSYSLNSCVSNEGIGWGTYMIMTAGPDNSLIIENFNNDICTDNQYWIDNGHPLSNTLYSSNEFMQYSFIFDCDGEVLSLQIGDEHAGGIVFQINEDGTGLVADLQDLGDMDWFDAMDLAIITTSQGYDDWYLPSIEELELMSNTIGQGTDNDGDFGDNWYWSSSEYDNGNAWYVDFNGGGTNGDNKYNIYRVRVIRAF